MRPVDEHQWKISSPTNNEMVIPNFSVWGECSEITGSNTPLITASGGGANATAVNDATTHTWEALLQNVQTGPQTITVTFGSYGSKQVTVNVQPADTFTIELQPPSPQELGKGANPWDGYTVKGSCSSVVTKVDVILVQDGKRITEHSHTTTPAGGKWSLSLSFVDKKHKGKYFCIDALAATKNGKVLGSLKNFFEVQSASDG